MPNGTLSGMIQTERYEWFFLVPGLMLFDAMTDFMWAVMNSMRFNNYNKANADPLLDIVFFPISAVDPGFLHIGHIGQIERGCTIKTSEIGHQVKFVALWNSNVNRQSVMAIGNARRTANRKDNKSVRETAPKRIR